MPSELSGICIFRYVEMYGTTQTSNQSTGLQETVTGQQFEGPLC